MLDADQVGDSGPKGLEEEEESTESLVCRVLTALQKLGENLETSKKVCLLPEVYCLFFNPRIK